MNSAYDEHECDKFGLGYHQALTDVEEWFYQMVEEIGDFSPTEGKLAMERLKHQYAIDHLYERIRPGT